MKIKNVKQIDEKLIELISELKGNQIKEFCEYYTTKNFEGEIDFKSFERLCKYYLKNQQPNSLDYYRQLHNVYNACRGFCSGFIKNNYKIKRRIFIKEKIV